VANSKILVNQWRNESSPRYQLGHHLAFTKSDEEPGGYGHVCRVCHLSLYVPSELHEQVQKAATAAGVKGAQWLRHTVRQIAITDFPASWQAATPRERSHDSRTHAERFMLRLDEPSQTKLQQLIKEFGTSKAAIIRHLIAEAEPEDFPTSWQMRAAERHAQQSRHRQWPHLPRRLTNPPFPTLDACV
jgi:hypothetical protein